MEPWEREDPEPESTVARAVRMNDTRVADTRLRVIDRTEPIPAASLRQPSARDASGVTRFTERAWSLPTFSKTYATHQRAGTTTTGALARALRALEGKFTIVNRRCTVSLPTALRQFVAAGDREADIFESADWIAFALHEPARVLVRHAGHAAGIPGDASREVEFHAAIPYRLTAFVGHGPIGDANALIDDSSAHMVPIEDTGGFDWFRVGLCLPDTDALAQMTEETAHFYRWITGRLGGPSRDRYWHLDAWEQYTEEGRIHGVVVPEFLRRERFSVARSDGASDLSLPASRWAPLTRAVDKAPLVPPGYCFIEFTARIAGEIRLLG
jgi:hypothetical protein